MSEWKELEIGNLPSDILVGDYEWQWRDKNTPWTALENVDIHYRLKNIHSLIRCNQYRYRKRQPKEPSHEERIRLIEWGCKYADGFLIGVMSGDIGLSFKNRHYDLETFFTKMMSAEIIYPLFLQRVCEGINRSYDTFVRLEKICIKVPVWEYFNGERHITNGICRAFLYSDFATIDQCKEAALKYIMDQEGKGNENKVH